MCWNAAGLFTGYNEQRSTKLAFLLGVEWLSSLKIIVKLHYYQRIKIVDIVFFKTIWNQNKDVKYVNTNGINCYALREEQKKTENCLAV